MIGQGVWILWGVENCHLPLTKPVAVNTGLALPRSPWWQYLLCCHHGPESLGEFTRFIKWMQTQRQMAANSYTKPNNLGCESAGRLPPSTSTIAILLLLSPKADTHFTVQRREEGWVDLGTAVRVRSPYPRLNTDLNTFHRTSFYLRISLFGVLAVVLTLCNLNHIRLLTN